MVVFEATLGPTVHARLPWQWRCQDCARACLHQAVYVRGERIGIRTAGTEPMDLALFDRFYEEHRKRGVDLNPQLWSRLAKSDAEVLLTCGLSSLSEEEVEKMHYYAERLGQTIHQRDNVTIEHMSAEEAAREIARHARQN
jgi:hypothetical protein